ncbi:MAG: hypothetical protein OHK0045_14680 [Raineya sp.]
MIVGKWEIDKEAMKADLKKEVSKTTKEDPSKTKILEESVETLLEKIQIAYEFKTDGSMTMLSQGYNTKGKWVISDNGETLVCTDENKQKIEAKISEISKNRLVLTIGSEKYTFKSVK